MRFRKVACDLQVVAATLITLASLSIAAPSYAQTAEQINSLLMKSKLVDTGRQVNTRVEASQTIISTFCHPKASDRDCKITALLMMKELRQHYKKILHIQVLFYDPGNPSIYRQVEIREGDIVLMDMGKPIDAVLGQIGVTRHNSAAATTPASAAATKSNALYRKAQPEGRKQAGSNASAGGWTDFHSLDGNVSISYPKTWRILSESETTVQMGTMSNTGKATVVMQRAPNTDLVVSLEDLANQHISELKTKYSDPHMRIEKRTQNCSGIPAIVFEASGNMGGSPGAERGLLMRTHDYIYWMIMYSAGSNDTEMSRVFQGMISSVKLRA